MTASPERHTVHTRIVKARAEVCYELAADVGRWPVIFGPSLYADYLERTETTERFRLWALVNGEVKSWVSRRELDPTKLHITFRQERSAAPIASMGGEWTFRPQPDGTTEVELTHDFGVVDDDPAALEWVTTALDRNSHEELAALARVAELGYDVGDIVQAFEDVVQIPGSGAEAYAFVDRADLWPDRLPHVSRLDLVEDTPGIQHMEMDTVTQGGHTHTTKSVRLCFPEERIVYKQLLPPALLLGHSGSWAFGEGPGGEAVVTARHMVALNPDAVTEVLGEGKTLADARDYVRNALGANSKATLNHAGAHAAAAREARAGQAP